MACVMARQMVLALRVGSADAAEVLVSLFAAACVVLRRVHLVQERQTLHQQFGVVGQRVAAERGDVFGQTAGHDQRCRAAQFFFDALGDAVQQHRPH